jgi:two-component system response regulator PilR (NtrC family)
MSTPSTSASLLVVDDEADLRTLYELTLLREGYDVDTAGSVEEARQRLQERHYHAVITDMRLPDGSGLQLLDQLEHAGRPEKVIVITAYGSTENAVEALKAGAYDYLTKPVDLKQFRQVIATAMGRPPARPASTPSQAAEARPADVADPAAARPAARRAAADPLDRMVGPSEAMQEVRALVGKVARSMAPVLVLGESGTGKELVARAIHLSSTRAAGPFIAVNCSAIPEQLLEAEFFGYRKGAFTGAQENREGFFQAAAGGTLFLDEIGDLPLSMQSKLLRVVQERAARPVGAVSEVPVDVRVVSATHKDLAQEVEAGRFRQDLYYRINVIHIRVPPLRERMQDLPELCNHILRRIAAEAGSATVPRLLPDALARLQAYAFPGNVRELENLLHRVVALSTDDDIRAEDLSLPVAEEHGESAIARPAARAAQAPAPGAPGEPAEPLPDNLEAYLDQVERRILIRALEQARYNRTAAGARLGLSLRQMRYRMARLHIEVEERSVNADGLPGSRGEP